MLINKSQAEKIYGIWCSSEDSRLTYKDEVYEIEYDEEGDVALVDEDLGWTKLTSCEEDDISVEIFEWVAKEVNNWKL